jgi:hypothetical protein
LQNPPISIGERVFYCAIADQGASSHCIISLVFQLV